MTEEESETIEVEEWTDTVDIEEMPDGPSTIYVGGFSRYRTINEALDVVQTSNDRIFVLSEFDGDVVIDTTKFKGVQILGATSRNTLVVKPPRGEDDDDDVPEAEEEELDEEELMKRRKRAPKTDTTKDNIVVKGRLILQYSEPNEANTLKTGLPENEEEERKEEEDIGGGDYDGNIGEIEEEEKAPASPPKQVGVTINGLRFLEGCEAEARSFAYIEDCCIGHATYHAAQHQAALSASPESATSPITVRLQALTSVAFERCQFYGSGKSVVYGYPHSRATFIDCNITGTIKPDLEAEAEEARRRKPRGYVPPPPPPPSAPLAPPCSIGLYADDANLKITNMDVVNVGIGVLACGQCKGFRMETSRVSQVQTVGVLLHGGCEAALHEVVVTLCGRDAAVFADGHPTIRQCIFVGDVRLKQSVVSTSMTDNTVALNHSILNEDKQFHLKGFTIVPNDPTALKKRKPVVLN